jgi:hypothetical protein
VGEDLIPSEVPGGERRFDSAEDLWESAYRHDLRDWQKRIDQRLRSEPHALWYKHQGVGLDAVNTIYLRWDTGSRLAQESRRFTPGQSGHSEAMAARLEEIARNLRQGQSVMDAKEALLWLCAAESERRREGPSTVDAQAHEVVDVQALGPA